MSLIGILLFIFALMLAIFLHEGGHFLTAKLFGMKVERFFLGFGKTLWSFRRGETEYGIKVLPLGGFCKIAGMSPHEFDGNFLEVERGRKSEPVAPERQFRNKPAWQRAIVLSAGSVTHFIMALVLIYALIVLIGLQIGAPTTTIQTTVATTSDGKPAPAAAAGLRSGDKILAIDGQPISSFDQLRSVLTDKAGRQVSITYQRDGRTLTASLVPALEKDANGQPRGFLGISPSGEVVRRGPIEGIASAGSMFGDLVVGSFKGIGSLPSGLVDRLQAPAQPSNGGGGGGGGGGGTGPFGLIEIGRLAGQAVSAGLWSMFIILLIEFNVFVGIFNLLPIPILDGGYLALIGWQSITRREVDLRKVAPVAAVAVSLLVVFVLVVAWLDITKPIANPFR
jgi:membrane-associated protease RseP (regulator of RpoE activity)